MKNDVACATESKLNQNQPLWFLILSAQKEIAANKGEPALCLNTVIELFNLLTTRNQSSSDDICAILARIIEWKNFRITCMNF